MLSSSPLLVPTPPAWFETAARRWRELLVDHANCEKKAASTALSLIFAYAADMDLAERISRLAREELRHFEQVQKMMRELQVPFAKMSPARYAEGLRRGVRRNEPERLLDLLLCGALIEARSCERFVGLVGRLPPELSHFYEGLAQSEQRHSSLYQKLAGARYPDTWESRLAALAEMEAELVTSPDPNFRFHSGLPVAG